MKGNEYIKFEISDEKKFNDFVHLLNIVSESKKSGDYKSDKYWLKKFPDYSLAHYSFKELDLKPEFKTIKLGDGVWYFYGMIHYLVEDIDIEFLNCEIEEQGYGILEFYACGYPYGGIAGLIVFLNSFGLKATEVDEGLDVYKVKWKNKTEFDLQEVKTVNSNRNKSIWQKIKAKFDF